MAVLTVITVAAAQYGARQLIEAIGGDPDLGSLAADVLGALSASEDRLGVRLAAIEGRLEEVLEQSYVTAVGAGLRTLVDAGSTTDPQVRQQDLLHARNLFREAASAARSKLQVALAERYLLLCALALGRDDAARNALARLRGSAFEAVLESAQASRHEAALARATRRVEQQGLSGRKARGRVRAETDGIQAAASVAADLAVQVLCDADVLAQKFDITTPAELTKVALSSTDTWEAQVLAADPSTVAEIGVWSVAMPGGVASVRFGPLSIQWHRAQRTTPPSPPGPLQETTFFSLRRSPDVLHVDLSAQVVQPLSLPVTLGLASPPEWHRFPLPATGRRYERPKSFPPLRPYTGTTLPAGARRADLQGSSAPLPPDSPFGSKVLSKVHLIIGGVFVVACPTSTTPGISQ